MSPLISGPPITPIPRSLAYRNLASRDDWASTLSAAPLLDAPLEATGGCVIRRWRDTLPDVAQPSLRDHYVVLHLGGAKRVHRRGEGRTAVTEVEFDAISIVPAGAAYEWRTEGPIDYAHIYLPPARLARATQSIFDRNIGGLDLHERVGSRVPLLASLFRAILDAAPAPHRRGLYLETLTEAFLGRLLDAHTALAEHARPARYALAPRRLAAVIDDIEARFAEPVSLDELAAVGRLSRFHFARAFAQATGLAPHAFLMRRRLQEAKRLLRETDLGLAAIARACGYAHASHFSNSFRRAEGCSPGTYRRG